MNESSHNERPLILLFPNTSFISPSPGFFNDFLWKIMGGTGPSISDCPNACSLPQITGIGLIGALRPEVSDEPCNQCRACVEACKENAISIKDDVPVVDDSKCLFCGQCIQVCPTGSLKEAQKGYRILVGGKLGRHPRLGTELSGIHEFEGVLRIFDWCLDHYMSHCLRGERFVEILERTGIVGLEN